MAQDVYVKGFNKSHGAITVVSKVDSSILNFHFDYTDVEEPGQNLRHLRDLMIENIGSNDIYVRFDRQFISTITIADGSTKYDTFDEGLKHGWLVSPGRPFILSYCDFTNIGIVCNSGKSSSVQIMGVFDN